MIRANKPGIRALECLNFFMADVQAGIGPFLGVYLQARNWHTGAIGAVMTLGGIVGMLATAPAGALVDATHRKRALVVISSILTVTASAVLLLSPKMWVVASSQIATALAGAALGPALAGITLGMVRKAGFDRQFGRNQAINHAGNVVGAALSGLLGWKFGFIAVFGLAALFAVFALVSVLLIPATAIDNCAARGWENRETHEHHVSGLRVLLTCASTGLAVCCTRFTLRRPGRRAGAATSASPHWRQAAMRAGPEPGPGPRAAASRAGPR